MQYVVYELGPLRKGAILQVDLTAATDVKLFDNVNYDLFRNRQAHNFYGGHVTKSPYIIPIPEDNKRWFLTVNNGSAIKHAVRIVRQ